MSKYPWFRVYSNDLLNDRKLARIARACDVPMATVRGVWLTLLAMALRLHASRNGSFPHGLEELAPRILPAIPDNPLTGLPFPYERTAAGCRLSSRHPDLPPDDEGDEVTIELGL